MIERCICPTIYSNRNTYPGQACIVDTGCLVNSVMWHIAEYKLDIDAVHLHCLEKKPGNW